MQEWSSAPLTLRLYIAVSIVWPIAGAAIRHNLLDLVLAPVALAIALTVAYFLLRRVRWLWIVAIVLSLLAIPLSIGIWWALVGYLILLGLLLAPTTRRYFARDVDAVATPGLPNADAS